MTEQWVDGFVSAVKSAGYDESAVPRILKIARLSEARRVNPDVFDAEFEKQAGWGSWLMNIAIALGLGWGGYQLLKKMYAAYVRKPPSWERGHAVNGRADASADASANASAAPSTSTITPSTTPTTPTTPTPTPTPTPTVDILKSPVAKGPVAVFDSNGRQVANTDRRVPPMIDPEKPGNMYKFRGPPTNQSLIITR